MFDFGPCVCSLGLPVFRRTKFCLKRSDWLDLIFEPIRGQEKEIGRTKIMVVTATILWEMFDKNVREDTYEECCLLMITNMLGKILHSTLIMNLITHNTK